MRKYILAFTLLTTTTALFADSLVQQVMKEMKLIPVQGKYKQYLKPYSMMSKKVTYAQFRAFMKKKPQHVTSKIQKILLASKLPQDNGRYPAQANFKQAKAFCSYVGRQTGKDVALPTEKQWMYAAMAGTKQYRYPTDNGKVAPGINIPSQKQVGDNLNRFVVDKFPPNPFGMYAMAGDGPEWTQTKYTVHNGKLYYTTKGSILSDIAQNDYSSSLVTSRDFTSPDEILVTFRCVLNH